MDGSMMEGVAAGWISVPLRPFVKWSVDLIQSGPSTDNDGQGVLALAAAIISMLQWFN